ncbi:MAG: hypothetical protein QNK29_13910 [Desulfobacterales bacterium]|nr:hypothetical protein [Desulfobacterales bacterium]MDX2513075.1 hypothetical protein [Desulfobacterales bacterium]
MESVPFPDNGGRRRAEDRRETESPEHSPEKRSDQKRREIEDRRETPRM